MNGAQLLLEAGVLLAAPNPSDGEEFNSVTVSPGLPGFFAAFVLAVMVVLLAISMTRHTRRIQAQDRLQARIEAEELAEAEERDGAEGLDEAEERDEAERAATEGAAGEQPATDQPAADAEDEREDRDEDQTSPPAEDR